MMDAIATSGSFAAAARLLGKVPSALTYNVRQLEDALDVLLFDRRSRQATLTAAGQELLDEGRRLLDQMDAVANRVKRVATGWETQLTVAVDDVIARSTMLDLCAAFYADTTTIAGPASARSRAPASDMVAMATPTRLRIRTEVLAGTWEALVTGHADLAIGVTTHRELPPGLAMKELGRMSFVFAVAPHHPLAAASEPIADAEIVRHRAVAVADSAHRLVPLTVNLLPGQDVLTVSDMQAKIEAQVRGVGCGFVPEPMARDAIAAGRLVVKQVERLQQLTSLAYAWRTPVGRGGTAQLGLGLRWWLDRLDSTTTRRALLDRRGNGGAGAP
ncbi:MAG TPA: LysR family transcriptional regulator [Caldimonas sp.]|nr:LysR family transcriptional regulator [Caldimonas sp.]HEX4235380.1 LysR family transcriptional regulator [Caldimonas sp.]